MCFFFFRINRVNYYSFTICLLNLFFVLFFQTLTNRFLYLLLFTMIIKTWSDLFLKGVNLKWISITRICVYHIYLFLSTAWTSMDMSRYNNSSFSVIFLFKSSLFSYIRKLNLHKCVLKLCFVFSVIIFSIQ